MISKLQWNVTKSDVCLFSSDFSPCEVGAHKANFLYLSNLDFEY